MIVARYFIGSMLRGYAIVALAMLALFGMFDVMDEATDIGQASYSASDALLFVAMSMPATLLDLAPFVVLLGTIFGLAGFLRTHELLALRAAGRSTLWVAGLALAAALIATAAIVPIEIIARPLLQHAILFRTSEQSPDGNLLALEGSWITRGNTFVYVGALVGGQRPSRVSIFEFGDHLELERFTHAASAEIASNELWRLKDVEISTLRPDGHDHQSAHEIDWRPIWSPAPLLEEFPLASLSLNELHQRMEFAESGAGAGASAAHALEFWRRALAPLSVFAFAILGAALVTSVRPRSGGGFAILIGIAAAIALYLFQQIGMNAVAMSGMPPVVSAALPTAILIALALAVARRANEGPH